MEQDHKDVGFTPTFETQPNKRLYLRRPPEVTSTYRPRDRVGVVVLLFALTFASAMLASALPQTGGANLKEMLALVITAPTHLLGGLPFALTLMTILVAHEMGHYLTARYYGVNQSLPFFIPAPTIFGTLGAIIVMRSEPPNRQVLLKVAVAGPLAGVCLAVIAAAWGLEHSAPLEASLPGKPVFGDSLLFYGLKIIFGPKTQSLELHPVALAGWVGLFITALNLIPVAQLDGGHIAYALFGQRHILLGRIITILLLLLGIIIIVASNNITHGSIWVLWAVFLLFMGVKHPPVKDESVVLTKRQKSIGAIALAVFGLTFIPTPLTVPKSDVQMFYDAPLDVEQIEIMPKAPTRRDRPAEEFRL